jgi:hypothetical protein
MSVLLRGRCDDDDDDVVSEVYAKKDVLGSPSDIKKKIIDALNDWDENWEGWKEKPKTNKQIYKIGDRGPAGGWVVTHNYVGCARREDIRCSNTIFGDMVRKEDARCLGTFGISKPKLRIKFVEFEKALVMQVLYMDERFRCVNYPSPVKNFIASNGFRIASSESPIFHRDLVMLRGWDKQRDDIVKEITFRSNIKRDEYKKRMLEALKEWAVNWEGWNEKPCKIESKDGIYEF